MRCCIYEPVKGAKQPAKIPHMVPTNVLATFAFLPLLFKAAVNLQSADVPKTGCRRKNPERDAFHCVWVRLRRIFWPFHVEAQQQAG